MLATSTTLLLQHKTYMNPLSNLNKERIRIRKEYNNQKMQRKFRENIKVINEEKVWSMKMNIQTGVISRKGHHCFVLAKFA